MTAEAPMLDLDQFLPYRLSRLSNRISQAIADAYVARFNLGVTEWRVMAVLGRFPGLSAGEVAERTAMDKVAVSRAVARLIGSGRVLRGTADGDRRRSVLRLSAAGRRTYQDVVPRVVAIEQQLLGQLDPAARTQLAALLDRLEQTFAAGPAPETEAPQRIPPGSS
jgi:DNA-binding MarR family transcriptional regulator